MAAAMSVLSSLSRSSYIDFIIPKFTVFFGKLKRIVDIAMIWAFVVGKIQFC